MANLTDSQIGDRLTQLGHYRVMRTQEVANQGLPDGISGSLILALGLRETGLTNVEGGAELVNGVWVPQSDPNKKDVGVFQISRLYHKASLALMPGVKIGTWTPVVNGKSAANGGYCPRFEDSLQYVVKSMHEAQAYGGDHDVKEADLPRFAVAAHNGGMGGALQGYRVGNVDKYTTGGDYSAWCLYHKTGINHWLAEHPNWRFV